MTDNEIGIIILAAGASSRLGTPKQLLRFEGKTLLRRAVETAIETNYRIIVVLGANFERTKAEIEDLEIEICFNKNWQDGMSSSLKTGLKKLLEIAPNLSAVIITLCDQPFINSQVFNNLAETFEKTNAPIVACNYAETIGVPALFSHLFFDELLNLSADEGARKIIKNHLAEVEKISVPQAEIDIDTAEDFQKLFI
ncbi:MAG TPA: nucleotidyltransferase family protein [Pyrinomonadaceae bacterium]|nr:nucleotidyltransferase family protein [Pyrinomonadaceae bacterium]